MHSKIPAGLSLLFFVVVVWSTGVNGCFQNCTIKFNEDMTVASRNTDPQLLATSTCATVKSYSDCMKRLLNSCDSTSKGIIQTTITSVDNNYNTTCNENASAIVAHAIQCSNKAGMCLQTFNFSTDLNSVNPPVICKGLDMYTNCTEELMKSPDCGPYMGQAAAQLEAMRNQYARMCLTGPTGSNAMTCFNRTLNCYDKQSALLNPADLTKNIEGMCTAMGEYSTCVSGVITDVACQAYSNQIRSGMEQTKNQHSALCGTDGGKTANKCMREFEVCYRPFNATYAPALRSSEFVPLCESINALRACTDKISKDCIYYLGKAMYGVEQVQKQYSYRCSPENRKHIACKPLDVCARDMIKTVVNHRVNNTPTAMCSNTADTLFPCVEKALDRCGITETGVPIRKVSTISKEYCLNFASDDDIRRCHPIILCQINENFTMGDPLQMTNGTFWCGYIGASMDCIRSVIENDKCAQMTPSKKTQYLEKVTKLQHQVAVTCIVSKKPTATDPSQQGTQTNKDPNASYRLKYGLSTIILSVLLSLWS